MLTARKDATRLACLLLALMPLASPAAPPDHDIVVRVQKHGQEIEVEVDAPVVAPLSVVWDVLTDYDHMSQFVSNLEYSGIHARHDNTLEVHQKGKVSKGPINVAFESVREVELVPRREIRSRLISGDMKASEFVTRIVEGSTELHIVNVGHYTPNRWVPPLIGPAFIEAETRKQFGEIRKEILRRSEGAATARAQ